MKKRNNKRNSKQDIENMKYEIANELGVSVEHDSCSNCNNSSRKKRLNSNRHCK